MIDYRRVEKVRKYAVKMGFAVLETRIFETPDTVEAILTLAPANDAPAPETEEAEDDTQ